MIWALLALLGIPLWFIGSSLTAVVLHRSSVRKDVRTFAFKGSKSDGSWYRRTSFARWESDVFIEFQGPGLVRTDIAQVALVEVLPAETTDSAPVPVRVDFVDGRSETIGLTAEALPLLVEGFTS